MMVEFRPSFEVSGMGTAPNAGFLEVSCNIDMPLILVLYVDDLFLTGADPFIYQCTRELTFEFEMKDPGLMHYFLGLED